MIGNHSIASPNLARSPSVNGEENDRKKKKTARRKRKETLEEFGFFFWFESEFGLVAPNRRSMIIFCFLFQAILDWLSIDIVRP